MKKMIQQQEVGFQQRERELWLEKKGRAGFRIGLKRRLAEGKGKGREAEITTTTTAEAIQLYKYLV